MYTREPGKVAVGELIDQLKIQPRDDEVMFGGFGRLTIYRVKDRSGVTQTEFNEVEASFSEEER